MSSSDNHLLEELKKILKNNYVVDFIEFIWILVLLVIMELELFNHKWAYLNIFGLY